MSFRITVTKVEAPTATTSAQSVPANIETEIFRQTVDDFNLPKFVVALNKQPRARKPKSAQRV